MYSNILKYIFFAFIILLSFYLTSCSKYGYISGMRYNKGYNNNLYIMPNDSIVKTSTVVNFNTKPHINSDLEFEYVKSIDTSVKNIDYLNSDILFSKYNKTYYSKTKSMRFGVKTKAFNKVIKSLVSLSSASTLKNNTHFKAEKIESKPLAIVGLIFSGIGLYLLLSISGQMILGLVLAVFGGIMGIYSFKENKNWLSIIALIIGIIDFLVSLFFILFTLMLVLFVFN